MFRIEPHKKTDYFWLVIDEDEDDNPTRIKLERSQVRHLIQILDNGI